MEGKLAEVSELNAELDERDRTLQGVLAATLGVDDYIDFGSLKERPEFPIFDPRGLDQPYPAPVQTHPEPPGALGRLVPGAKAKYEAAVEAAEGEYGQEVQTHAEREKERQAALALAKADHDQLVASLQEKATAQNAEVDAFRSAFEARDPKAIVDYFSLVLAASRYPDRFPQAHKVAWVPESKQLVVEYDVPPFDVIPEAKAYRYVKAKDEIVASPRPAGQRKSLYASVVAQVALRTVHELFEADRSEYVESIVLNAHVDSIDPRTGQAIRPCLVTLRTTRENFAALDLSRVTPEACLRGLNAAVSKEPV